MTDRDVDRRHDAGWARGDHRALAAAALVFVGAVLAWPVPRIVALVVLSLGLAGRRPSLAAVGVALFVAGGAHAALAALGEPLPGEVDGWVTLGGDPVPAGPGIRVEVIADGRRYDAFAYGAAAGGLRRLLTGERVELVGRVRPRPADRPDLRWRHLAGRIEVESVADPAPAAPIHRLANGLRRTLAAGVEHLREDRRALVTGVVYGDDRAQSETDREAFRAAGLSHLLAVSGQNVAFVLAVAGPLLRRMVQRTRAPAVMVVLAGFGLVTRFEPSVLRATFMAGTSAVAGASGRVADGMRLLAIAVVASLILDPLLVGRLGFQLSVTASLGILALAPALSSRLRGPRALREALAVTIAAQLMVAPLLVATFGSVPVVALPANLLAVPAAGPMMMWGLTAGLLAGLLGGVSARILHLPTDLLARWLEAVAHTSAGLHLGGMGLVHVSACWVALLGWLYGDRRTRLLAAVGGVTVLVHAAALGPR